MGFLYVSESEISKPKSCMALGFEGLSSQYLLAQKGLIACFLEISFYTKVYSCLLMFEKSNRFSSHDRK